MTSLAPDATLGHSSVLSAFAAGAVQVCAGAAAGGAGGIKSESSADGGSGGGACAGRGGEVGATQRGAAALRDWREFYGARGIDLATKEDVRKVKAYVEHLHHLEGCLLGEDRAGEKIELLGEEG